MKKTITKPDGTQEVVEGTAEEIAAYERQVRQEPVREETKKPGLLTDDKKHVSPLSPLRTIDLGNIDWQKFFVPQLFPHNSDCEVSVAARGAWFCVNPPKCTCGANSWTITTVTNCVTCGKPLFGLNSWDICNCMNARHWYTFTYNSDGNNQCSWKIS